MGMAYQPTTSAATNSWRHLRPLQPSWQMRDPSAFPYTTRTVGFSQMRNRSRSGMTPWTRLISTSARRSPASPSTRSVLRSRHSKPITPRRPATPARCISRATTARPICPRITPIRPPTRAVHTFTVTYYTEASDMITASDTAAGIAATATTVVRCGFAPALNSAVGTLPADVDAADFNGDGKQDLVVANYGSNTISFLRGN